MAILPPGLSDATASKKVVLNPAGILLEVAMRAELSEEKNALARELYDAMAILIFKHGKVLQKKLKQATYHDDYGNEIRDKFLPERDYFVDKVLCRDIPREMWDFFSPDHGYEARLIAFDAIFQGYIDRMAESSDRQTGMDSDCTPSEILLPHDRPCRPINEIIQQTVILREQIVMENPPEFKSDDPLYEQAVAIVLIFQNTTISHLQRHLLIKPPRAPRLLDQMAIAGVVSPVQSDGTRQIMISEIVVEPSSVSIPVLADDGPAPKKRHWWAKIWG